MTSVALESQTETIGYNGWTNRETWLVNLWLTNDECYYDELCGIVKNFETTYEQAEELERYVHWIVDKDEASMASDLLTASLGRVSWYEIAEANQE